MNIIMKSVYNLTNSGHRVQGLGTGVAAGVPAAVPPGVPAGVPAGVAALSVAPAAVIQRYHPLPLPLPLLRCYRHAFFDCLKRNIVKG